MFSSNLSEELLFIFSLEELLEMSNLTHEEVLSILLDQGMIEIPQTFDGPIYKEELEGQDDE